MRSATTLSCTLLMTAVAFGQDGMNDKQDGMNAKKDVEMRDASMKSAALLPIDLERSSYLIGAEIHSSNGESLGELKDVLIDSGSGTARYAVLSCGGVLGMGDKVVAIPFKSVRHERNTEGECKLSVDFDEQRIENLPDYDSSANAKHDETWERGVNTPFGETKPVMSKGKLAKLSKLDECNLMAREDETIGDVEQVVIDLNNDRVAYIVVGAGGFLGMGESHIAFPWKSMSTTLEDEGEVALRYPHDTERLTEAPQYDDGEWERMASPVWVTSIYKFHNSEPYWTQPIEAGTNKRGS